MQRIITILIAIILRSNCLFCQTEMDKKLLFLEEQIFISENDSEKNNYLLQKIKLYIENDSINKSALKEVKRVNPSYLFDSIKKVDFFWNAAIICHLSNDHNNAKHYLSEYNSCNNDTLLNSILLKFLIFVGHDSFKAESILSAANKKDTAFSSISCLNEMSNKTFVKGKKIMIASSYFVPGSGTIMAGRPIKGIVSLLAVGALGAGTYSLAVNTLYLNALFVAFPWFYKFYNGQARLTRKTIEKKEDARKQKYAQHCEVALKKLLEKYPIEFK
jgi:hypothetical protein